MYQLILASSSPRRRQILEEAGFEFRVNSVKVSERFAKNLTIEGAIQDVAVRKAKATAQRIKIPKSQKILIVSADTVVILENQVLGKPKNQTEAVEFLRRLSAKTHRVVTAVCTILSDQEHIETFYDETLVEFRSLLANEISSYVATGEPMDRAGAYAIQGGAAGFVQSTKGSWYNVVGFPIERFEAYLQENQIHVTRR